jgi:hypothetical protein
LSGLRYGLLAIKESIGRLAVLVHHAELEPMDFVF